MPIVPNSPAPYAPVKHVLEVVERVRQKGMPQQLTKEYLELGGLNDAYANRTLRTFKLLDLVSDDGVPTAAFRELKEAGEQDYRPRLEQIIRTAYASVFEVIDPATDTDKQVEDAFRKFQPEAQRDKMVTLFLGLCEEAGIIPPGRGPRKRGRMQSRPDSAIGKPAKLRRTPIVRNDDPPPPPPASRDGLGHVDDAVLAVVRKLPVNATWTAAERERWLTALKGNVDLVIAIAEAAGVSPTKD